VGGESDGKNRSGGPAEEEGDRMREEGAGPTEVSSYVTIAAKLGVRLGSECAREKNSKEKKNDPADLARERGLGGLSVPVPVRAL
jgi:hypothetical protein